MGGSIPNGGRSFEMWPFHLLCPMEPLKYSTISNGKRQEEENRFAIGRFRIPIRDETENASQRDVAWFSDLDLTEIISAIIWIDLQQLVCFFDSVKMFKETVYHNIPNSI